MSQLFDRLDTLFRSLFTDDDDGERRSSPQPGFRSGDPDLYDAMDELDAFLNDDREQQERIAREREERRRAEDAARSSSRRQSNPSSPPQEVVEAFATMGLKFGTPFAEVKATYKRLLKENHPDKHGSSQDAVKRATEYSAKINNAFSCIETWAASGKTAQK